MRKLVSLSGSVVSKSFVLIVVCIAALVACAPVVTVPATPAPSQPTPARSESSTPPTSVAKPVAPAPTVTSPTQTREKALLRATWKVSGQYAPAWVALDKGFFAEEGIDAEVNEGSGSGTAIQTVAAGSDDFAISLEFATMMKARESGIPVKSVATLYQKNPGGIVVHASANVKSIKDLAGKTVAMAPGSSTATIFKALLQRNGVDPNQVTIVNLDAGALMPAFLAKRVDATSAFVINEVIDLEIKGISTTFLNFADYGPIVGTGIVASEKIIKDRPEVVRRAVRAIQKGLTYSLENPDDTADFLIKRFPNASLDKGSLAGQVKSLRGVTHTEESKKQPLGTHDKLQWEKARDFLFDLKLIDKKLPVEEYYTNEFLSR